MRCINRRHGRVRHDRGHAICPACHQSRDRSRGNTSARWIRVRPHCPARIPVAAPAPSRPPRSRHFPSMSAPPGASVSWLRSLLFWRFPAGSFHHLRKRTQVKARRFTASCGHSAAGEVHAEGVRERTEAAALHTAGAGFRTAGVRASRRRAAGEIAVARGTAARTAAGGRRTLLAFSRCRHPRLGLLAIVARHQCRSAGADRHRAHHQQHDLCGALRWRRRDRRGRRRSALAEFVGGLVGHGQ
jgi:hypothetical protein